MLAKLDLLEQDVHQNTTELSFLILFFLLHRTDLPDLGP